MRLLWRRFSRRPKILVVCAVVAVLLFVHSLPSSPVHITSRLTLFPTSGPRGPRSRPRYAFATFLAHNDMADPDDDEDDGYFLCAQVLAYKLLHDPETRSDPPIPFVVMVTDDVSRRKRDRLARYGATVVEIDKLDLHDYAWIEPWKARWRFVMSKLRMFGMTQYDKICFMDADHLVVRRLDGVFEDPAADVTPTLNLANHDAVRMDEAPQPRTYVLAGRPEFPPAKGHTIPPQEGDWLNAGFLVFRPSREIYEYYMSILNIEHRFPARFPEQGLLNYAHRPQGNLPWRHLTWTWNMNWARFKDYQAGVRSFHARYFLDRPHFDPRLKRMWRGQRWKAKSYFVEIGLDEA